MNNIDKMPVKCRDCPYWELAVYPWYCEDCTNRMKKPVSDFVSRQWLIDEYHRRHEGPPGGALKMIEEAPAADVEPKRSIGWWIPGDYVAAEHGECVTYPGEGITCSCCHYGFKARFLWSRDYCPHCGSRMLLEPPKEADA